MRRALLAAAVGLAACAGSPPQTGSVAPAPSTATSAPPAASAPASAATIAARPPSRPIVFAGAGAPRSAAWIKGAIAIATHESFLRVSLDDAAQVKVTPLARPVGGHPTLAVSAAANLVAVALDDGSVDVFRGASRLRTIDRGSAEAAILDLRFGPGGRSIAVTRSTGSWPERTVVYDVETGAERAQLGGGNVVFDDTGAWLTARGGLFEIATGRTVHAWKEGFYVLGMGGMTPMSQVPMGSEVVAQDYTARGFVDGLAVFAGGGEVELVEPKSGAVTKIPAPCGGAKKKRISVLDAARGRVFGVCPDAILLTDVRKRTTERVAGGPFGDSIFPPTLTPLPGSESMFLLSGATQLVVDPVAKAIVPAPADLYRLLLESSACLAGAPRVDIPCAHPAKSPDGKLVAEIRDGALVVSEVGSRKHALVLGGGRGHDAAVAPRGDGFDVHGSPGDPARYHLGGGAVAPAARDPAAGGCGKTRFYPDGFTSSGVVHKAYVGSSEVACVCTPQACASHPIPAGFWLAAAADDGTILAANANSTHTETTLRLQRAGRRLAEARLVGYCSRGAIAPDGRVFALCRSHETETDAVVELSPKSLAVLGKRPAPFGVAERIAVGATTIAVEHKDGGVSVALAPIDWVVDAKLARTAAVHLGSRGALVERAGAVVFDGDAEELAGLARCWDGERLLPPAACLAR